MDKSSFHNILVLTCLILVIALTLSSCTNIKVVTEVITPVPELTVTPSEIPIAAPITITIWHQYPDSYLPSIAQIFMDYEVVHPGVTINLSKPDDISASLKVALPLGEGPDILAWTNDQIGVNAKEGNIVDLGTQGITLDWLRSIFESASVTGVTYQGKIWALPETEEGIALVYNKDLVDPKYLPTDPLNFDDLLSKIKQFKADFPDKDLLCNQGFGGEAYYVAPIFFGFGVPQYVDDTGKVFLNTPEALKAAKYIQKLGQVLPKEENEDICRDRFIKGEIGIFWTGPWAIADIETANIHYGILPMGRPFVSIKTYMLASNAVTRGTAAVSLDIMKYFTSAEIQAKLALINKTIPAETAALANPDVAGLESVEGFGAALALGVPKGNIVYANAQWGPIGDAIIAIWNSSKTPEQALADAQAAIEETISRMP
jgi:arabinogalactan oligomer / maltooligosaccharide transport system substrate-binding protein